MRIVSDSTAATVELGRRLGALAEPGQCLALDGPLGAGKTHLVRGVALGAQVADANLVSSPTYVLLNIYPADAGNPRSKTIYHLDAYRTRGPEDFAALDLDEFLAVTDDASRKAPGIVVIEWAARIGALLPEDHLAIGLDLVDDRTREISLAAAGPRSERLLEALAAALREGLERRAGVPGC